MKKGAKSIQELVRRLFFCFSIFLVSQSGTSQAYTTMGNVNSYVQDGYNITFDCARGKVRVSFLTEDLVRVHMAPAGREFPWDDLHLDQNGPYAVVTYTWPGVTYQLAEAFDPDVGAQAYTIQAGKLVVKIRKQPFKLYFYDHEGHLLVKEKAGTFNAGLGYSGSKVYETMHLPDDEHFFGFGAHNHSLDMRGHSMTCYATELQTKDWDGGFPVPFFLSSRGYGIFFNNLDDDVTFRMGTSTGQYSFEATSGGREGWDMDYYLIYGPRFENIMKRYTDIVGKPILPEKWLFGHIQHHCCSWTADNVMEVANKYRIGDWPCDVLIMDHQALAKNFAWDSGYENYQQMYEYIDEKGFKTAFSCALFDDIYDWKTYDPTVEQICRDHWALYVPRVNDGMDFWRQDNSERSYKYTGITTFASGYESHELFGSLWAKNIVEGMEKMGLYGRPVISRGGPIGGHRYIIPWPGDLSHGIEFLETDLNWLRNGGLSGYSSIAVDLGGFIDRGGKDPLEEQNLIRRTINIIPIVPISKFQGMGDRSAKLPWLLSPEQQDLIRYYLKLRYRLLPYRYSSAIEAHQTGRPILGSLVFDYQEDKKTYGKDYHFMLGRQILVAPVTAKTEQWNAYLPQGRWVHYWTGNKYMGGQTVTVNAALYGKDGLPMFVKAGAIIPMMPEMDYIYEKAPDPITLDVYPDRIQPGSYVMYDCETVISPVTETLFTCTVVDVNKIEVSISDSNVAYELWVHCDKESSPSLLVDLESLPEFDDKADYDTADEGWYYGAGCFYGSESMETLNIKIPKSSTSHLIQLSGFTPLPPQLPPPPPSVTLKVDIGAGGRVQEGFVGLSTAYAGDLGGTGIHVRLATTDPTNNLGFRDNGFHPLFGDLVHVDGYFGYGLTVTLSGLETGTYTMTSCHNHIWMGWTPADIDIYVNDDLVLHAVPQSCTTTGPFAGATFEFTATEGHSVEIKFLPLGPPSGPQPWDNVALNGFEVTSGCRSCADFNSDGIADSSDLRVFADNWLWTGQAPGYNWADLDCDGTVTFHDFALFALQWLQTCE